MRTPNENVLIHLALRQLGKSTESQCIVRHISSVISGIWRAAVSLGHVSSELGEIENACCRLYLFSDHRLPQNRPDDVMTIHEAIRGQE